MRKVGCTDLRAIQALRVSTPAPTVPPADQKDELDTLRDVRSGTSVVWPVTSQVWVYWGMSGTQRSDASARRGIADRAQFTPHAEGPYSWQARTPGWSSKGPKTSRSHPKKDRLRQATTKDELEQSYAIQRSATPSRPVNPRGPSIAGRKAWSRRRGSGDLAPSRCARGMQHFIAHNLGTRCR